MIPALVVYLALQAPVLVQSTDTDWQGDTCAESDEGCPGDLPYNDSEEVLP